MRKLVAPVVAVLAACALAAPVASADDASLRQTVTEQSRPSDRAATRFLQAAEALDPRNERTITRLRGATTNAVRAFGRFASAVGDEEASSSRGEKAKTALMKGLEGMVGGLRTFNGGLARLAGGNAQQAARTMRAALRKIRAAQRDLEAADRLMPSS